MSTPHDFLVDPSFSVGLPFVTWMRQFKSFRQIHQIVRWMGRSGGVAPRGIGQRSGSVIANVIGGWLTRIDESFTRRNGHSSNLRLSQNQFDSFPQVVGRIGQGLGTSSPYGGLSVVGSVWMTSSAAWGFNLRARGVTLNAPAATQRKMQV